MPSQGTFIQPPCAPGVWNLAEIGRVLSLQALGASAEAVGESHVHSRRMSLETGACVCHEVLSLVVPMFNEEALIGRTVEAVEQAGARLIERGRISDYELIIVDDGSTDATGRIADELARRCQRIDPVHHAENRGLGEAGRTGFAKASGTLVLYMDGDPPFDLNELDQACAVITEGAADVFCASRMNRTSEGVRRACYSFVYNALVRRMFRLPVDDVNFAFKVFRREVLDGMELTSRGSFIDAEMLIKAHRNGYRIVQRGVQYYPRTHGVSTLSSVPVILTILRELFAFRRGSKRHREPS